MLHVSVGALRARLRRGQAPKPFRLGDSQRLFWRSEDIDAWIELQAREQGAAYSGISQHSVDISTPQRRRPGRPRKQQ